MRRVAVLVSGGGTNLQALLDFERAGLLRGGKIALVVSNKPEAFGLVRAKEAGVKSAVVESKGRTQSEFEAELLAVLRENGVDVVVLAGFLRVLSGEFVKNFEQRMLNVHPSLLPKFGGVGMYGLNVHRAVLASGERVSGASVHFVSAGVDEGEVVLQREVAVESGDTPESLQERIMREAEWKILPEALNLVLAGLDSKG